jgi:uncharacterized protein (TIGR02145 family)
MIYKCFFILSSVAMLFIMSCSDNPASTEDNNNSPTVSIMSPSNNSEFDDGVSVNIKADASDDDGIKEVRYYIDDIFESTDSAEPWEYEWDSSGKSGSHIVFVRAYDTNDIMSESQKITIKINNGIPVASFTVLPSNGDSSTEFQVDASGSTDREDPVDVLQVRWDWEDDGAWDTDYSISKTASHQYDTEGTKTIRLEVQDSYGQTDTTSMQVIISNETGNPGIVTDFDGNEYHTVKIGNQWWLVENLRVTHYRNGTAIPYEPRNQYWAGATNGAYCYYDSNIDNISEYGLLYNFHAVDNSNQIAPEGWHVASNDEWKELEMYLGMSQEEADLTLWRGTDEGGKLKETGTTHWDSPNTGATNETGFTAIPGGSRDSDFGAYGGIGRIAYFWTSTGTTASNSTYALIRALISDKAQVSRSGLLRKYGLSVRCVKD